MTDKQDTKKAADPAAQDTKKAAPAPARGQPPKKTTKLHCFESRASGLTVFTAAGECRFQNHTFNTDDEAKAAALMKTDDVRLIEIQTIDERGQVVDVESPSDELPWRIKGVDPDSQAALARSPSRFSTKMKAEAYRRDVLKDVDGTSYEIIFQRGK